MNNTLINGINVYSFRSWDDILNVVLNEKKSLIAINAEKILHANLGTRAFINQNIGYPDGIGAVWALKQKGFKETIKIPGCELWLKIIERFYQHKTFYLLGSTEDVIQLTVKKLKSQYPGIKIIGFRNGYISSNEERDALINDIQHKQPDIVFVAMGSPKQEDLIVDLQKIHSAIYQGLGGSFDVYIGNVKRAPDWWVKNNLEWTYRLIKQPQRIKRQIYLLKFAILLLLKKY